MNHKLLLLLSGCSFACFNVALSAEEMAPTNDPPGSLAINYTNTSGVVTSKRIRLESTNLEESAAVVATNYVSFLSSLTNADQTNSTPYDRELAQFIVTNATTSFATNSAFIAEVAAVSAAGGTFFSDLKMQGRLPGISKDSHGDGTTDDLFTPDSRISQTIKYPYSMTIHFVLTGDSLTNHYTIMQPSRDSSWQLLRAWRTDTEGHVIKEWPVK